MTAFGDGDGITVLAGGTIVMPELTHRRLKSRARCSCSGRSGLDRDHAGSRGRHDRCHGGRSAPGSRRLDEPLASAARHVADVEIRAQATRRRKPLRGGLVPDAPRGDLQAPLIALGRLAFGQPAQAASASSPSRTFSPAAAVGGSCSTSPTTRATARPRTQPPGGRTPTHYSILAVRRDEDRRWAGGSPPAGAGPHAIRLTSAEQSGEARRCPERRRPAGTMRSPRPGIARSFLPTLVSRALADLS